MLGLTGVTEMLTSVAGVTVSVVLPVMPADVAEMLDVPTARAVAVPRMPDVVTLATVPSADCHVAACVRSCVVLSVYVPIAVNCTCVPLAMEGFVGVTAIEDSVAG